MPTDRPLTLQDEKAAFEHHLDALRQDHEGEWAVVRGGEVIGFFPSHEKAYEAGLDRFGLDAVFLIAQVKTEIPTPVSVSWSAGVLFEQ